MKRYIGFTVVFVGAFIVLQQLSGALLMMLYTPNISAELYGNTGSTIFASEGIHSVSPLAIALLALVTAFGVTKLFGKRLSSN